MSYCAHVRVLLSGGVGWFGLCLLLAGCSPALPGNQILDATPGSPAKPIGASSYQELESNDAFETANSVLGVSDVELIGALAAATSNFDRDVFVLDAANAGDRIHVTLTLRNGSDVVVGLFDARQRLLAYLDPYNWVTGPDEIDLTLREGTAQLYVVVGTHTGAVMDRGYTVNFSRATDDAVLGYRPQILVLSFGGAGQVRIGNRQPVDVPPFDAASIDERFAGRTEDIVQSILYKVREDYAGLDIEIYRDGDPAIPAAHYSTLHFGAYDPRLLGLADDIDPYNANPTQHAILYTDTFAIFQVLRPSEEQIAQALANVASHEAGHLLGLRHTIDPMDLMDVTATARQMLADQTFGVSPLHDSVLPMGLQDAPQLLAWALGGSLSQSDKTRELMMRQLPAASQEPDALDFYIPRDMLGTGCTHAQELTSSYAAPHPPSHP